MARPIQVATAVICILLFTRTKGQHLEAKLDCGQPAASSCGDSCHKCLLQGLRCLQCGCEALCLPDSPLPQTPLWKCSDGSLAAKCRSEDAEKVCADACKTGGCTAYQCGGTCSPVCSTSDTGTQQQLIDLHSARPSRSMLGATQPDLAAVKEGDVMCPDGITPARACLDDSKAQYTCAQVDCRDGQYDCRMFSCPRGSEEGSTCIPLCILRNFQAVPGKCPPAYPEVQCSSTPCAAMLCRENTECVVNNCGNCTQAECRAIQQPDDICVDGPPVNCLVDPCRRKECRFGRTCAAEYCGGCNAACILKQSCPNGKSRRPCLGTANRCMLAKCGFGATCVPDQCNDCAPVCVKPCPAGRFVNKDTASCTNCPLGRACPGGNEQTGTPDPIPCNGGFYADERGLAQCKRCRDGTSTPRQPRSKGYSRCIPIPRP